MSFGWGAVSECANVNTGGGALAALCDNSDVLNCEIAIVQKRSDMTVGITPHNGTRVYPRRSTTD